MHGEAAALLRALRFQLNNVPLLLAATSNAARREALEEAAAEAEARQYDSPDEIAAAIRALAGKGGGDE